ncbi:MAG: hypothetical protein M0P73_02125 [Syntrophobacterales bacterium]|nr:hypothetical protein [Syntrophobacterales bacterium]
MDYLAGMSQAMLKAAHDNTSEDYSYVATELVKAKEMVSQALEKATAAAVKDIIPKLENNQPLTEEEQRTVRLWVIGDAEGYVKMENNFNDWLAEYRRLQDVIGDYERTSSTVQSLAEVHGVLEDAIKVADAIAHFLDDKERVARFDQAMTSLNAEDNKFIAGVLRSKLAMP